MDTYESSSHKMWEFDQLQSLYWTIAFGLANVIFELNCKQVMNDVFNVKFNRREYDKWLYGAIHTR